MSRFLISNEVKAKITNLRQSGLKHKEIGIKLGLNEGTVKGVCKRLGIKKPIIKPKPKPKKKDTKVIDNILMEKGHVKLKKGETILPTRTPKAQRSVHMYDNKNTIKFVDLDDPRSNEEIRIAWRESEAKKLKNLSA